MRITIITLFPDFFISPLNESILARAQREQLITINTINPRDFATDKHRTCDDLPYGGGSGMVLKPEPIFAAVESITTTLSPSERKKTCIISLSAKGKSYTQHTARSYSAKYNHLILICGHYEGIDERINQHLADEERRIGNYVLTGGEIPALIIIDSVTRLLPGVLGNPDSTADESFTHRQQREYPHYTRPADFRGYTVPHVLLEGNHAKIKAWREQHRP